MDSVDPVAVLRLEVVESAVGSASGSWNVVGSSSDHGTSIPFSSIVETSSESRVLD